MQPKRPRGKSGSVSSPKVSPPARQLAVVAAQGDFDEVLALIEAARQRAYQAVNTELIGLYWQLGEYISHKIESAQWGDGVVDELAAAIARQYPGMRGYTRRNLFRMRQFFEAYRDQEEVSPLVSQLPWTHHLIVLSRTKHPEEREFYMLAAIRGRWTKRELERQIKSGAALRAAPSRKKVSPALTQIHPTASPRGSRQAQLLRRGPRPRRQERARAPFHRSAGRRSRSLHTDCAGDRCCDRDVVAFGGCGWRRDCPPARLPAGGHVPPSVFLAESHT
jgi:predicted nuclease of restriction endonuclease-like (RecB) superfamily